MLRVRPLVLALTSLGMVAGAGAMAGCPDTTTTATYTPITGVTIHVSELLGRLQCGTASNQVYKYTVVVWDADGDGGPTGAPLFSNVWDCFTDGVFENLPVPANGDSFFMRVFAYSYAGTLAAGAGDAGPGDGSPGEGGSASAGIWCPGGLGPNATLCPLQDASFADSLGADAQWMTTCLATETEGAPVTAACAPLVALGSPAPTGSGDAQPGPTDAADAGDAAATDATDATSGGDATSTADATDATAEATTD